MHKYIICKFEATGSLDVAPERGRRATTPAIVEEVAFATADLHVLQMLLQETAQ